MLGGDAVLILAADLAGSQGQAGQKGMIVATGSHHAVKNGRHSKVSDCHVQAPATASGGVKTVLSAKQRFAHPSHGLSSQTQQAASAALAITTTGWCTLFHKLL